MKIKLLPILLGCLAILVVVPFLTSRSTASISWKTDYSAALSEAKSQDQMALAYFYTDWCSYCKEMEKTTFQDADVIDQMGKEYVWLKLNAETDPVGLELGQELGITSYPTIVIMDYEGQEIDRLQGFIPPERFIEEVSSSANSPNSLVSLRNRIAADPGALEARLKLGREYLERRRFSEALNQVEEVLNSAKKDGNREEALLMLAETHIFLQQPNEALEALNTMVADFPNGRYDAESRILRGEILLYLNRREEGLAILKDFLRDYPDHPYSLRVQNVLGVTQQKASTPKPAASH